MAAQLREASRSTRTGIVRAAALLSAGNVTSRVLGLVREQVISYFFGATVYVSSFRLADRMLRLLYDLIVGGMLSGAVVPVFSEYAHRDRLELARLASALLTLLALFAVGIALLIEILAVPLARLLAAGQAPQEQLVTAAFFRWMAPAIILMSLSSGLLALLYALKRFRFAALATAVYNTGIILGVPVLKPLVGPLSLGLGVLLGATLQLLVLLPDVRDVALRVSFYWRHPGLRRIGVLYAPVALALLVSLFQGLFDGRLATFTGPSSLAYMANATTLVQFPLGLVAMAVSYATLPTLARMAVDQDWIAFRRTLGLALRLVSFLSIPAAVGLFVLAEPIVRLIFEHGAFTPQDTVETARALRVYAIGLIFAAADWPLNYAFYARQNTWVPTLVGIGSVGVYLVVALSLMGPLGMVGLVWGDTAKQFSHALTMFWLTRRRVGRLEGAGLGTGIARITLAAVAMAAGVSLLYRQLAILWPAPSFWQEGLTLGPTILVGGAIYWTTAYFLGVEEARLLPQEALRRLRAARHSPPTSPGL